MAELTNTDRAGRAQEILVRYNAEASAGDGDLFTAAVDLAADVCHLADQQGWNPARIIESAWMHFIEEVADESDPEELAAASAVAALAEEASWIFNGYPR